MTRNPTLRPSRPPGDRKSLHDSLLRIAIAAAAGFVVLFLATALFWK